MIPPASARKKWLTLTIAVVVPLTWVGVGVREQQVEASQRRSLSNSALPDGTYLYSNVPQPNQISHQYVLFQQREGKVVGAFYSPQAEFSCFAGGDARPDSGCGGSHAGRSSVCSSRHLSEWSVSPPDPQPQRPEDSCHLPTVGDRSIGGLAFV